MGGKCILRHGGEQRLVGPFLLAPYVTETSITVPATEDIPERQRLVRSEGYAVILPEDLKVFAKLAHTMRERGVYSAPVYGADVAVSGAFVTPDLRAVIPNLKSVQWEQAAVVIGVSDLIGLAAAGDLAVGGGKQAFEAVRLGSRGGCLVESSKHRLPIGTIHNPVVRTPGLARSMPG